MSKLHFLLVYFLITVATVFSFPVHVSGFHASQPTPCDFDAPENFAVSDIGATWVTLNWSLVLGAEGYKIKVFKGSTGQLVREMLVPADAGIATITGLDPGTDYRSLISSVCAEGIESAETNYIGFKTFILDLVVTGFTQSNNAFICTIGQSGNTMCTFPLNGTSSQFLITNGMTSKVFALQFVNETFSFILQNTIGNYQFWGINTNSNSPIPAPAYNINHVYVTANNNGTHIADLFVEKGFNGDGQLRLGAFGIAEGYVIHRIKWNGPTIEMPEEFGGPAESPALRFPPNQNTLKQDLISLKNNISVANPFHDQIALKLNATVEEPVVMQLFDLQGRLLLTQENTGGAELYTIATDKVDPGLYLLRVEIGAYTATFKLIKV